MFFIPEGGDYIMNGRTNTTSVTEVIEGVQVPLEAPTDLIAIPMDKQVNLTWTDPLDKYAAPKGQIADEPWDIASKWDHTSIVRKEGSDPISINDGILVGISTIRDQYKVTQYIDTSDIINNTEYHYGIFAISSTGISSDPITATVLPRDAEFNYKEKLNVSYPSDYSSSSIFNNFTSAANTTNHAIFVGLSREHGTGAGLDYGEFYAYQNGYAYDSSGTKSEVINAGGHTSDHNRIPVAMMSASAQGYAFFGGGYFADQNKRGSSNTYGCESDRGSLVNPSLTTSRLYLSYKRAYATAGSINDKILCYGGTYTRSGTGDIAQTNTTYVNINGTIGNVRTHSFTTSDDCGAFSSASTNTHVIFCGGQNDPDNNDGALSIRTAYDNNLTENIGTLPYPGRAGMAGVSFNGYAIFAGGYSSFDSWIDTIICYNDSLTQSTMPVGLFTAVQWATGLSYENNMLFVGGMDSRNEYITTGTLFDGSFTRKNIDGLSSARFVCGAMANNTAFFYGNGKLDIYKYE